MNESGDKYDLRKRTLEFALRTIRLCAHLPNTPEGWAIRKQLVKSGTSPGAHYREACRARSTAEFISKMEGGLQELDETAYWLEILLHSKLRDQPDVRELARETEELISIFVSSAKTAKKRN